jgi:hypothetical protein
MRTVLGAMALGVMLAATAPAFAAPPAGGGAQTGALTDAQKTEAKKHYGEGEKKFKAGDYAGALPEFQAADAIKSTPQAQRYIGLCQDNLGHYTEAVAAYDSFLANVPDKLKKEGEEIKAREAVIKAMPARLHIDTTPPGASIMADGKSLGTTPTDVELAPGKHILHLELAGYLPIDRDLDLTFGQKQDIKTDLTAKPVEPVAKQEPVAPPVDVKPAGPPPEQPKPESHSKLPAIITGSLAIVAIGIGTGFGIAALAKQSDFNNNPTADTADTGENFALVADMAFGVAITLGVTSAVLFLTKDDDAPPPPPPANAAPQKQARAKKHPLRIIPTPFVLPNGGGAGAFLRF